MSHTPAPAARARHPVARPDVAVMRHSLRLERDGAVAHVVLIGPGKGNAMGPSTWIELAAAFDELEADQAIRAVVLSCHGEHFSFGLDVGAMVDAFDLARDRGAYVRRDL